MDHAHEHVNGCICFWLNVFCQEFGTEQLLGSLAKQIFLNSAYSQVNGIPWLLDWTVLELTHFSFSGFQFQTGEFIILFLY